MNMPLRWVDWLVDHGYTTSEKRDLLVKQILQAVMKQNNAKA
jgi:hypothetical protein